MRFSSKIKYAEMKYFEDEWLGCRCLHARWRRCQNNINSQSTMEERLRWEKDRWYEWWKRKASTLESDWEEIKTRKLKTERNMRHVEYRNLHASNGGFKTRSNRHRQTHAGNWCTQRNSNASQIYMLSTSSKNCSANRLRRSLQGRWMTAHMKLLWATNSSR